MAFIKKIKVGGVSYDISLNKNAFGSGLWIEQYGDEAGKLVVSGAQLAGSGLIVEEGCKIKIDTAPVSQGLIIQSGVKYQVGINENGQLAFISGNA